MRLRFGILLSCLLLFGCAYAPSDAEIMAMAKSMNWVNYTDADHDNVMSVLSKFRQIDWTKTSEEDQFNAICTTFGLLSNKERATDVRMSAKTTLEKMQPQCKKGCGLLIGNMLRRNQELTINKQENNGNEER